MKPNIQDYFRYHYDGSGNLQISIANEFVKELGWGKDLELSFGGIRSMNDWGTDPTLTIHNKKEYKHPWYEKTEDQPRRQQPDVA